MVKRTPDTVGGRIRHIRGNLTQIEFAEAIGISQPKLSNYETNRHVPSQDVLLELAICSGKSIEWILTGKSLSELRRKRKSGER